MKIYPIRFDNYKYKNINYNKLLYFKGLSDSIEIKERKLTAFDKIIDEFKAFPEVEAIAIGGSSKSNTADKSSDIDIEIYTTSDIPVSKRNELIKKYSSHHDIGQDYFGAGDEFYVDDIDKILDIAYFDKKWMDGVFENVWQKHNASNGYTTCFLYTIDHCEPLYDKNNWLNQKKELLKTPYPQKLRENIIKRNMMLLKDKPFASYYEQIQKALLRGDTNSVNHRLSAFMESYFDIIFALNYQLHPGEKRLVQYALKNCKNLPQNFEENISHVLTQPNPDTLTILDDMLEKLRECL